MGEPSFNLHSALDQKAVWGHHPRHDLDDMIEDVC